MTLLINSLIEKLDLFPCDYVKEKIAARVTLPQRMTGARGGEEGEERGGGKGKGEMEKIIIAEKQP